VLIARDPMFKEESPYKPDPVLLLIYRVTDGWHESPKRSIS
jgi:hypothetical protein